MCRIFTNAVSRYFVISVWLLSQIRGHAFRLSWFAKNVCKDSVATDEPYGIQNVLCQIISVTSHVCTHIAFSSLHAVHRVSAYKIDPEIANLSFSSPASRGARSVATPPASICFFNPRLESHGKFCNWISRRCASPIESGTAGSPCVRPAS